jgi:hypothetical protein
LTNIFKKNAFHWKPEVKHDFIDLKQTMCTTPVLDAPDFNQTFFVEFDTSGIGIGTVITQEGRPLSFTSHALSGCNFGKYTYEKEMMAILHVVHTWQSYLLGNHFHLKTNHHSLKYFLE